MIRLYWWNGPPRNLGDALQPLIVEALAADHVQWAPPEAADLIAGGSILQIAEAKARPGTPVWGAGYIADGPPMGRSDLVLHAVRGPLSARRCGGSPAIGDPVALAPKVFGDQHHHGEPVVAPHYADPRPLADGRRLDLTDDPLDLVRAIAGASHVTTSSLHAWVLADAYDVPATFSHSPHVVGDGYKVADWRAGLPLFDADALLEAAPW